jgi:4-carboxymuconolactone decarboxylase
MATMTDPREPRISPLPEAEWTDEIRKLLEATKGLSAKPLNIFTTLARHPQLFRRWLPFGGHVLFQSTLPPRERELVILRVGALCDCPYEVAQHVPLAKTLGVTDAEIERVKKGPEAPEWSEKERALLQATGELHATKKIHDTTWQALRASWSEHQVMDLIFLVGHYTMIAMALNGLGVQVET